MRNSALRNKLLAHSLKLEKIEFQGDTFYLREATVSDINFEISERQKYMIALARKEGIEVNIFDEKEMQAQLSGISDRYGIARGIASHLCDDKGVLLFDPRNLDDLESINNLPGDLIIALKEKTEPEVKN